MASIEQRNGIYRVVFRFGGQKFSRSLRTKSEKAALGSLARLEDNLRRVELGTLNPPPDADLAAFLLSDGRLHGKTKNPAIRTLAELCQGFFDSLPNGTLEDSTLKSMEIHVRHLKRILGERFRIQRVGMSDLQGYVEQRAKEKGLRNRTVSARTIKMEITTLTTIWGWARGSGFLDRPLPKRDLRYPKTAEKPPFQTWEEIERKINRGGLSEEQQAELWDCLFLTLPEISELLEDVKKIARHAFIYPMFAFAAHTGARRSEMLRSQIEDIDFAGNSVTIREKKRVRGKLSTRTVPMSPFLYDVMEDWLSRHIGGNYTFCLGAEVMRSRSDRNEVRGLTRDEAHDHFKRTLAGSKWEKLRGWHVFRHSFCSNCAAAGVDQRVINAWVGHQTEDMVRRYRHLIPNQQQAQIQRVFGGTSSGQTLADVNGAVGEDCEAEVADACAT